MPGVCTPERTLYMKFLGFPLSRRYEEDKLSSSQFDNVLNDQKIIYLFGRYSLYVAKICHRFLQSIQFERGYEMKIIQIDADNFQKATRSKRTKSRHIEACVCKDDTESLGFFGIDKMGRIVCQAILFKAGFGSSVKDIIYTGDDQDRDKDVMVMWRHLVKVADNRHLGFQPLASGNQESNAFAKIRELIS